MEAVILSALIGETKLMYALEKRQLNKRDIVKKQEHMIILL